DPHADEACLFRAADDLELDPGALRRARHERHSILGLARSARGDGTVIVHTRAIHRSTKLDERLGCRVERLVLEVAQLERVVPQADRPAAGLDLAKLTVAPLSNAEAERVRADVDRRKPGLHRHATCQSRASDIRSMGDVRATSLEEAVNG